MNRNDDERPLCSVEDMVRLARAGDLEALDRITRCYGQRMLSVGRRYGRCEEDARDAVQEALLSAGRHLKDYRGEGSLEGWLIRMVANACHHMRRGRKNDPALHDRDTVVASVDRSPESLAEHGELLQAIGDAMMDLPPQDRLIVMLAEAEEWTGPQIAQKLQMTPGSVRTRLSRARQRIRQRVDQLSAGSASPA